MLYQLFEWTHIASANLVLIVIGNAPRWADKLQPKTKARMGTDRLLFGPYSKAQYAEIVDAYVNDKAATNNVKMLPVVKDFIVTKLHAYTGDVRKFQLVVDHAIQMRFDKSEKLGDRIVRYEDAQSALNLLFENKAVKVLQSLALYEVVVVMAHHLVNAKPAHPTIAQVV